MVNEKGRKHLPPYVSYRTFRNFVDRLQQRLPSRIDRSYWGEVLSGSSGTQLMAALRFLGLIDANGKPLERLRNLAAARGEQRSALMKDIALDSFKFVLNGQIDLESATYSQLQEVFHNTFQVTEDVSRKCASNSSSPSAAKPACLSPLLLPDARGTSITFLVLRRPVKNP